MENITAVHRHQYGHIINFQTTSGRIISYQKALQEVNDGIILGIDVLESTEGLLLTPTSAQDFNDYPLIF